MMEFTALELTLLVGLGVLLALDQDAGMGLHLAQPLVAGGLAGWILGRFEAGVALGGGLQLLWMTTQPVGGARLPDLALASLAGVLALPATWQPVPFLEQDLLAAPMLVGILAGWAGGWVLRRQRQVQTLLVQQRAHAIEAGRFEAVAAVQHRALLMHAVRASLAVLFLAVVAPLLGNLLLQWGLRMSVGRLAAGIGIVSLLRVSGGGWKWAVPLGFLLGFLPGVL
jgi:mannose/fructose/N-acetylgalactosamine-specific phosphotransferase system component IIC